MFNFSLEIFVMYIIASYQGIILLPGNMTYLPATADQDLNSSSTTLWDLEAELSTRLPSPPTLPPPLKLDLVSVFVCTGFYVAVAVDLPR
jgi:hypothetical protein